MDLYLIRHADAIPLCEQGITDDADRPLSEKGQLQVTHLAAGLQRHGVKFDVILTSPLLRSRQTAEGLANAWPKPAPEVQIIEELVPGFRLRKLARAVRNLDHHSIALVGHEPHLGQFAGWLHGNRRFPIPLEKAGVAYFSCSDGVVKTGANLVWLINMSWMEPTSKKG